MIIFYQKLNIKLKECQECKAIIIIFVCLFVVVVECEVVVDRDLFSCFRHTRGPDNLDLHFTRH